MSILLSGNIISILMVSLIIAILIGIAGALITYNGIKPYLLFLLRFLGFFLLVAFLLGLTWRSKAKRPPKLTVLLDVSESMSPLKSWQDSIIRNIKQPKGWKLEKRIFSSGISEFTGTEIKDTGKVTDLERAIRVIQGDALFLLSDGLYNTPKDPMKTAYELKRPIFVIIPPEKTTGISDVILRSADGDRKILEGGKAKLKATIQVTGSKDYSGRLVISEGDSILKKMKVYVPSSKSAEIETELSFDRVGAHNLTFTLSPSDGERTLENNQRKFSVIVSRGRREAWILSWHPSPNVASFKNFIENVPGWGVRVLVEVENGRWEDLGEKAFGTPLPKEGNPDLWILIDPSPQFLAALLSRKTVAHIVLYLEEPSQGLFPLLGLRRARKIAGNKVYITLNPSVLNLIGSKGNIDLPPLKEIVGVIPPKVFKPIVTAPSWKTPSGSLPVISTFEEGPAKEVLIQAGDLWKLSLWNKPLFQKLFYLIIKDLFKGEGIYSASVSKTVYFEGEPIQVGAYAQSSEGEPINDITVNLVGLDRNIPLWPIGKGHYESPRLFLSPGSYDLKVVFKRGKEIKEKRVSLKVMTGSPEVYDVGIDSIFLERISTETGGEILNSPEEITSLSSKKFLSKEKTAHPLVGNPLFLILFVALVGLEWGIRKWKGLP